MYGSHWETVSNFSYFDIIGYLQVPVLEIKFNCDMRKNLFLFFHIKSYLVTFIRAVSAKQF